MKKEMLFFMSLLFIGLSSCTTTKYFVDTSLATEQLDFSKGKWLLLDADSSSEIQKEIINWAQKDLASLIPDRLDYIGDLHNPLLPTSFEIYPSRYQLQNISEITDYDYIICFNTRNQNERKDSVSIEYKEHVPFNRNYLNVEIYNLKKAAIIYSKAVIVESHTNTLLLPEGLITKNDVALLKKGYTKLFNLLRIEYSLK